MPKLIRPLASMGPGLATPLSDRNIAQFLVSLTLRLSYILMALATGVSLLTKTHWFELVFTISFSL